MKKGDFTERRRYVRLDTDAKITFQIQPESSESPSDRVSTIAKNLSIEGICFICGKKLEPGSFLKLEVFFPEQPKPLCLEGRVKWSQLIEHPESKKTFITGLKLFTIPKSDESRFMGYVCDKMTQSLIKHLHL